MVNETHTGERVYDFHIHRNHVPPSCTSVPPDVVKKMLDAQIKKVSLIHAIPKQFIN